MAYRQNQYQTRSNTSIEVYYGSRVLQGTGIIQATRIGKNTILAQLMNEKKWPSNTIKKQSNGSHEYNAVASDEEDIKGELTEVS